MKKTVLSLLALFFSFHVFAQDTIKQEKNKTDQPSKREVVKPKILRPILCPNLYITTSTGINNNTGLLGFILDVPVAKYVSIEAGAGISSWGYKIEASGKYYLKTCQRGWAFGAGFSYNTGRKNYERDMQTTNGTENVSLDLHEQTNFFIAAYYYWSLGKRYNRFYIEPGYSIPLSTVKYVQKTGDPITSESAHRIKLTSPGGIIISAGFSFVIF